MVLLKDFHQIMSVLEGKWDSSLAGSIVESKFIKIDSEGFAI